MQRNCRILIFNDTAAIDGGAERSVVIMNRYLNRRRFTVEFASCSGGEMVSLLASEDVKTSILEVPPVIFEPRSRLLHDPFQAVRFCSALFIAGRALAEHIRHGKFDLMYTYSMKGHLVSLISTAWHRVTTVWDIREVVVPTWFIAVLLSLAKFSVASLAVQARRTQRFLGRWFPIDRVAHIPNYLDLSELSIKRSRGQVRQQFGLNEDSFVVISAGRITPNKGFHILIKAMQSVPKAHLLICGTATSREDERYLASIQVNVKRVGLQDRVLFLGYRRDLLDLLAASDLAVLLSFNEQQSRFIMEAMGLGLPVIVSDVGGLAELVAPPDAGWIVPAGNPEALSKAIRRLQENPTTRYQLGESATSRIRESFDIQHHITAKEAFFYESIDRWKQQSG